MVWCVGETAISCIVVCGRKRRDARRDGGEVDVDRCMSLEVWAEAWDGSFGRKAIPHNTAMPWPPVHGTRGLVPVRTRPCTSVPSGA